MVGGIVILASCEYHFIRVHKNLVQHPCNNILILVMHTFLLSLDKSQVDIWSRAFDRVTVDRSQTGFGLRFVVLSLKVSSEHKTLPFTSKMN